MYCGNVFCNFWPTVLLFIVRFLQEGVHFLDKFREISIENFAEVFSHIRQSHWWLLLYSCQPHYPDISFRLVFRFQSRRPHLHIRNIWTASHSYSARNQNRQLHAALFIKFYWKTFRSLVVSHTHTRGSYRFIDWLYEVIIYRWPASSFSHYSSFIFSFERSFKISFLARLRSKVALPRYIYRFNHLCSSPS